MTFRRLLPRACASGTLAWAFTQAEFWLGWTTYQRGGWLLYERVLRLAFWPNFLIENIYKPSLPDYASALMWPLLCVIALAGWLVLATLLAGIVHGVLRWRRPRAVCPPPLPATRG